MGRSKIFEKAIELSDKKGYKELQNTDPLTQCNSILINHTFKSFFFTTIEVAKKTVEKNNKKYESEIIS